MKRARSKRNIIGQLKVLSLHMDGTAGGKDLRSWQLRVLHRDPCGDLDSGVRSHRRRTGGRISTGGFCGCRRVFEGLRGAADSRAELQSKQRRRWITLGCRAYQGAFHASQSQMNRHGRAVQAVDVKDWSPRIRLRCGSPRTTRPGVLLYQRGSTSTWPDGVVCRQLPIDAGCRRRRRGLASGGLERVWERTRHGVDSSGRTVDAALQQFRKAGRREHLPRSTAPAARSSHATAGLHDPLGLPQYTDAGLTG